MISDSEGIFTQLTLNVCFCRLMMAGRTVVIPPPISPHPEHQAASTTSPPADAPPSHPPPHPAPQTKGPFRLN